MRGREVSAQEPKAEPGSDDVNFKFDGTRPNSDLLSYKNMMMEMSHSAFTDVGCSSLAATIMLAIVIGVVVLVVVSLLLGG